ncbi:MAG: adenine deaminase [candidate division WOR-3 bacterium]
MKLRRKETVRGVSRVQEFLRVARGEAPADILLRGGQVVDVFTGEVRRADVVIKGGSIAGVGLEYRQAKTVIDIPGLYVAPGFIEGHVHIESSLLSVREFARLCLINGTTTVVADPHEIANVSGVNGVEYIRRASQGLPVDFFIEVPSCVPATAMESAGATLGVREVAKLLKGERVIGLAEVMNYPGVIFGDPGILGKIELTRRAGKLIDGHAPGLTGLLLQAYAGAGIGSDHESVGPEEVREKLRAGMRVFIREGKAARNLTALLPVVNDFNLRRFCLVADDPDPGDLLFDGHLNSLLRRAVSAGLNPVAAIQLVTINPAEHFRLYDRGAVAPGLRADLVVLKSLTDMQVKMVFKDGRLVARDRQVLVRLPEVDDRRMRNTVRLKKISIEDFAIKAEGELCNVIRIVPDQIITERHVQVPTVKKGMVVADTERDLLKIAVIERHRRTGRMGKGLVAGFGLKKGALATTVAHDSHNIIVVGTTDLDMLVAVRALARMGGGYVAAADGKVAAALALPIAGLMSDRRAEVVVAGLKKLLTKARSWGCRLANPFVTLSFLALAVIPELKITDRGLIDVNRFQPIGLFVEK